MPQFKVGDAVRVKAGSPDYSMPSHVWVGKKDLHFGKRLVILEICKDTGYPFVEKYWRIKNEFLEPWNDTEEWNGTAWVAKKKSEPKRAVVRPGQGSEYYSYPSTNAAVRFAEKQAAAYPGTEFVVYQEKASFKVEKPSRKIGSQWRVCWRQYLDDHVYFANGTIVTLVADDCAIMPLFCGPSKQNGEMRSACVEMKRLEPV